MTTSMTGVVSERVPPNPSGFCMCGCGRLTPTARYTSHRDHMIRGEHLRYLRGHYTRINPKIIAQREERAAEKTALCADRRARVAEMYRAGASFEAIGRECSVSRHVVNADVMWLRAQGVELPYRNRPTDFYLSDDVLAELERMWNAGMARRVITEHFGWSTTQYQTIVAAVRAKGGRLDRRTEILAGGERSRVTREFRKVKAPAGSLTERRKILLRLMGAVGDPVGLSVLNELHAALGYRMNGRILDYNLQNLRVAGLVDRVRTEDRRYWECMWLWFVPFNVEQPRDSLTLADAKRESELAALIREQEADAERGDWATNDGTISLDMQIGEGATFHDILRAR